MQVQKKNFKYKIGIINVMSQYTSIGQQIDSDTMTNCNCGQIPL